MEDIFQWCREGNAMQIRVWLDDTEHDMNQGYVSFLISLPYLDIYTQITVFISCNFIIIHDLNYQIFIFIFRSKVLK